MSDALDPKPKTTSLSWHHLLRDKPYPTWLKSVFPPTFQGYRSGWDKPIPRELLPRRRSPEGREALRLPWGRQALLIDLIERVVKAFDEMTKKGPANDFLGLCRYVAAPGAERDPKPIAGHRASPFATGLPDALPALEVEEAGRLRRFAC